MNRRLAFSLLCTAIFLAGAGIIAQHHELWRDEMQAWLIARDLPSLSALLVQGRYDGTPPLWFLLLRPLTLFTHRPEAMQVLNWGLAGLTIFLICHFSPFKWWQKLLLLPNYYFFYEYGTVCRQYLLGVLFLSIACTVYPANGRRPWIFAVALVGLAMSSVYGVILSVALAVAFWGPALLGRLTSARRQLSSPARLHLPSLLVVIGGVALAVYWMLPEPDTFYAPAFTWHFGWDPENLTHVGCAFTNGYFLLPRPNGFFSVPAWLRPLSLVQYVAAGLVIPIIVTTALVLKRSAPAVIFYLTASIGILLFLYGKYLGFTRHVGSLFLALFFATWLYKQLTAAEPDPRRTPPRWFLLGAEGVFSLILALQAVTGIWAAREDYDRPFSCGKMATEALVEWHWEHAFITAWPDNAGTVVAGYLDRTIYFPQSGRWGSFTRWDRGRKEDMSDEEALSLSEKEAKGAPMVVYLDHSLPPELLEPHGLAKVHFFQGSLTSFEDAFIYYRPAAGGVP